MTLPELDKLAYANAEMPELTSPEQLYYQKMRCLYQLKSKDFIDSEQGKREKTKIKKAYESDLFMYECQSETTAMRNNLSHHLIEVRKSGCPMCKKAVQIFDGTYRGLSENEGEE